MPCDLTVSLIAGYGLLGVVLAISAASFKPFETSAADWEREEGTDDDGGGGSSKGSRKTIQSTKKGGLSVIVAGASRTGTSSTNHALQVMGYHTEHWVDFLTHYFEFISYFLRGQVGPALALYHRLCSA